MHFRESRFQNFTICTLKRPNNSSCVITDYAVYRLDLQKNDLEISLLDFATEM